MRKVVQGYLRMESTELNKLNILFHCRSSQSLYYANVYYTLGLSEVSNGPGCPNPYWGLGSEQMCPSQHGWIRDLAAIRLGGPPSHGPPDEG